MLPERVGCFPQAGKNEFPSVRRRIKLVSSIHTALPIDSRGGRAIPRLSEQGADTFVSFMNFLRSIRLHTINVAALSFVFSAHQSQVWT
jgi:hypothetical protein